jgi:hypothetical protein
MSMLDSEPLESSSSFSKLWSSEGAEAWEMLELKPLTGVLRAEVFLEDLRMRERSGDVLLGRLMGVLWEALERGDFGVFGGRAEGGRGGSGLLGGRPMPGR